MRTTGITLDYAGAAWRDFPTADNAARLIAVALEYWSDEMIGDLSLAATLAKVNA